jgi:hypothetical protein
MRPMPASTHLRLAADASPADWLTLRVGPFGSGVGGLLPHGFDAYARILHPAFDRERRPVRWGTVAEWSGHLLHPLVQFRRLMKPPAGSGRGPVPYFAPPPDGNLPEPTLAALCRILASHTTTADRCWFCLWQGYGWVNGSPAVAMMTRDGRGDPIPPAFGPESLAGPHLRLPQRNYMLFEGPLEAASEMGWWPAEQFFDPQSPNIFWPADHAWCAATEIDLDSTYVGGSTELIADLLADACLEALPAAVTDDVTAGSDEVNS